MKVLHIQVLLDFMGTLNLVPFLTGGLGEGGEFAQHWFKYEPRHDICNNVVCATSKGSDQPAHTRSLIRAFASRLNIL